VKAANPASEVRKFLRSNMINPLFGRE